MYFIKGRRIGDWELRQMRETRGLGDWGTGGLGEMIDISSPPHPHTPTTPHREKNTVHRKICEWKPRRLKRRGGKEHQLTNSCSNEVRFLFTH